MKKDQTKEVNIALQLLKRKGLVAFASFGLLVSLIIMGTTAWYTRINDVSGITLNVAKYDFKAEYTSNEFTLDAGNYISVDNNLCAPGTVGVIPIILTNQGNTSVTYSLGIDSSGMADEFKARIRYFYYDAAHPDVQITLNPGESVSQTFSTGGEGTTEYIYWEWVYELDANKFYDYTNERWVVNGKYNDVDSNGCAQFDNSGNLKQNTSGVTLGSLYLNYNIVDPDAYPTQYQSLQAAKDAHDDFDYKVGTGYYDSVFTSGGIIGSTGKNTIEEKYMSTSSITYDTENNGSGRDYSQTITTVSAVQIAMQSKIIITGVQANPSTDTAIVSDGTGKTTYRAISSFTSGVAIN